MRSRKPKEKKSAYVCLEGDHVYFDFLTLKCYSIVSVNFPQQKSCLSTPKDFELYFSRSR